MMKQHKIQLKIVRPLSIRIINIIIYLSIIINIIQEISKKNNSLYIKLISKKINNNIIKWHYSYLRRIINKLK